MDIDNNNIENIHTYHLNEKYNKNCYLRVPELNINISIHEIIKLIREKNDHEIINEPEEKMMF